MMLLKEVQYLYLQGLFLLTLCSELATAFVASDHINARFLNQTSNHDELKQRSVMTWPSPTVTTLPPQNWTLPNEPSVQSSISRQFISCSCDPFQRTRVRVAWAEAKSLTDAIALYKPIAGAPYYNTMQRWMGNDVASRGGWFQGKNFQKIIGENIKRRIAIDNNAAPRSTYIYYSCPDMTDSTCRSGKTSYVYNSIGYFWTNHYIRFCPKFFNTLDTMAAKLSALQSEPLQQRIMNNYAGSQALVMFTNTWGLKYTVSDPVADKDYATLVPNVWLTAKNFGAERAYVNAASYAYAGMAIKAQQHFRLSQTPIPREQMWIGATSLNNDTTVSDVPAGFVGASDPNVANSRPDLSQCAAINAQEMANQWTQIAGPPLSSTTGASTATATKTSSSTTSPSTVSATEASGTATSSTATSRFATSSIAASLSCALPDSVPTGVPQDLAQANITAWCGLLGQMGEVVGCDNKHHNGFYLSTSCDIPSIALDYDYPDVIMTLNISITEGSVFTVNVTSCNSALSNVLNDCGPLSTPPGTPPGTTLMKYGGNKTLDDGMGHAALFSMKLTSNPGNPGNQPGDPGLFASRSTTQQTSSSISSSMSSPPPSTTPSSSSAPLLLPFSSVTTSKVKPNVAIPQGVRGGKGIY